MFTAWTIKQSNKTLTRWCPWPRVWLRIHLQTDSKCQCPDVSSHSSRAWKFDLCFLFCNSFTEQFLSGKRGEMLWGIWRNMRKTEMLLSYFIFNIICTNTYKYSPPWRRSLAKKLWCHLAASANRHSGWLPSSRDQDLRRPHDATCTKKTSRSHPLKSPKNPQLCKRSRQIIQLTNLRPRTSHPSLCSAWCQSPSRKWFSWNDVKCIKSKQHKATGIYWQSTGGLWTPRFPSIFTLATSCYRLCQRCSEHAQSNTFHLSKSTQVGRELQGPDSWLASLQFTSWSKTIKDDQRWSKQFKSCCLGQWFVRLSRIVTESSNSPRFHLEVVQHWHSVRQAHALIPRRPQMLEVFEPLVSWLGLGARSTILFKQ